MIYCDAGISNIEIPNALQDANSLSKMRAVIPENNARIPIIDHVGSDQNALNIRDEFSREMRRRDNLKKS